MSRVGRLATVAAAIAFVATVVVWNAEAELGATAAAPAGGAVFQSKGCAACHSGPDSSSSFGGLPSLVDVSSWAGQRRPGMSAADYLRESVRNPSVFVSPAFVDGGGPTSGMPDLGLTDGEIDAVVEYLLAAR